MRKTVLMKRGLAACNVFEIREWDIASLEKMKVSLSVKYIQGLNLL